MSIRVEPASIPKGSVVRRNLAQKGVKTMVGSGELFGTEAYLSDVRERGGLGFVERAERYARTEQGKPMRVRGWFREYLRAIGDWRIGQIYTSGAAQTGKTFAHLLAFTDLVIHGRMDVGWAYASHTALIKYQKQQFRPVIEGWSRQLQERLGIDLGGEADTKGLELYQVGGVSANFSFASSSIERPSSAGKAIISGSGASYSAAALGCDERSRWPNGVDLSARLGYSPIATKPTRDLGTPGGGQGIEKLMAGVDRAFYPHYRCANTGCSAHRDWAPLDPKGCLFTPEEYTDSYGRRKEGYFSDDGRPMGWWWGDPESPVSSARFCCSRCGTQISLTQRTEDAEFRCTITGQRLADYLEDLPKNFDHRHRVSIHLSPLCRENSSHLARDLVEKGLKADDPRVWQQEDLGIPSSGRANRLTEELLRPLIGAPTLGGQEPWKTFAGLDYGRGEVWLWINAVHVPADWRQMDHATLRRQAIREVKFGGRIHRDQVVGLCREHGVTFGLADSEPDTTWSASICQEIPFEMVDQIGGPDDFRRGTVRTGGEEYPCWKIFNAKWHWDVLRQALVPDAFDDRPSYRFPKSWAKWLELTTEESPLRHLRGPSFDQGREKWLRAPDKVDDLFYAALFAEAAFAIHLDQHGGGLDWSAIDW